MKKTELMKTVSTSFSRMCFQIKKHSPEILIAAGVIGTVASAVMACRATTKVSEIINNSKNIIDSIHDCEAKKELAEEYTKEDVKKDLTIVYLQTGLKLARLYAPAVALGAFSLSSILVSNNILRKRNVALAAAYAAVDQGFKEYRNRVVERFGEETDRELRHNIKAKKIEVIEIDPETGKEKKVKKTVNVSDNTVCDDYVYIFDRKCPAWESNSDYNMMFLRSEQNYANDLLKARGHIFLNEILDRLGFERTKEGQIVGWVYKPDDPMGDNYVDFRMFETTVETSEGYDEQIRLDFNVDGNVLALI